MEKRDETSEDTAIKAPFAEPRIGPSLAQADIASATGAPEIGRVSSLKGTAQVTGGDGISQPLSEGDPVHQGDRVATGPGGELTITFADGTSFYLGSEAAMVLDEMVYEPEGSDNSLAVKLLQGLFVLVTGEAAETGGMVVETPVGTVGIRGTTVGFFIDPVTGLTRIVNLADPITGEVGRFVFVNQGGTTVFAGQNQELGVSDAAAPHGALTTRSGDEVEALFGHGLETLIQANPLRKGEDEVDDPDRTVATDSGGESDTGEQAPSEGGALSEGSGAAASLTAAMYSLSSASDQESEDDGGLIGLISATEDISTPSGLAPTTATVSNTPNTLFLDHVWSGAAGDDLWHTPGNWYIGNAPGAGADVRIEQSGAHVTFAGSATQSDVISSLTLDNGQLVLTTGKLGVQADLSVGSGATLVIDGGDLTSFGSAGISGALVVQQGMLEVTGGHFRVGGTLSVDAGGILSVKGGVFENAGQMLSEADLDFSGGHTLINSGSFNAGLGTASIALDGFFDQPASGRLVVEVSASSHDSLTLTGQAHLHGELFVGLLGGFVPNAGDSFVFLTASQVMGAFDRFTGTDINAGREFKVSFTNTTVSLIASDKASNGADQIYGTAQPDFLRGFAGDDQIFANQENDVLQGDAGNDLLNGGAGRDTASFASSPAAVIANLSGTVQMSVNPNEASDGFGNLDTLVSIENLDGSGWNDFLYGGSNDNLLDGHEGTDQLTGGAGSDTFVLRAGDGGPALANADVITDYADGSDIFGLADGLAYNDLTISDGGTGDTRISVTATGEYLALVQGVADTAFDPSDFAVI